VLFVDLARSAAVLFMVQGHTLNALLDPRHGSGSVGDAWLYLRGLTACMFLTLSGFSFSLATHRHWDDYRSPGRRVARRLSRYALLLVLGYGMRFPSRTLSGLPSATPEQWQAFAVVDILQLVAVTLALLQVLSWFAGSRHRLMAWSVVAAAAVVVATPVAWRAGWATRVPLFLGAYLTADTGSIFPALPWAAYVFLGAGLGFWYVQRDDATRNAEGTRTFWRLGLGMLGAGAILHQLPWAPFGDIPFWTISPNLFLVKAGSVLLGLAAATRLTRFWTRLPRVLTALSRESLLVYLGHVMVLYGSVWTVGLAQGLGQQFGPVATGAWVAALLAVASMAAWAWHECKHRMSQVAVLVRVALAAAVLYAVV
jgi:uncharacterized membrane protein